jgi:signal transduction histidine kinase
MSTRALLRIAGVLVWLVSGLPAALGIARDPGCMPQWGHPVWLGAFAVFGLAFWKVSAQSQGLRLIAVQSVAALTMLVFICTGFESALLVVVAVQLGLFVRARVALPWLLLQSAGMTLLAYQHMPGLWLYWSVVVTGIEAFAFVVASIAAKEAAARRALAAAQDELARLSRDAERLRIARELHDLLGHDLVALNLHLEAARHLPSGPEALAELEQSRTAAKALLADLREAVGALREGPTDIRGRLTQVASGIAAPKVHLEVGDGVERVDEPRAQALVRCVQEIVTNAAKHAGATNLWISVSRPNGAVLLTARDDGKGSAAVVPGHGLNGMRERLSGFGGDLRFESAVGQGFTLHATLPVETGPKKS